MDFKVQDVSFDSTFEMYEKKFKALADKQRLRIMHEVVKVDSICVCDLAEIMEMPQSKLSYHLKILVDADLLNRDTSGTWSYYSLNEQEVNNLLSEELCCLFRKDKIVDKGCC